MGPMSRIFLKSCQTRSRLASSLKINHEVSFGQHYPYTELESIHKNEMKDNAFFKDVGQRSPTIFGGDL